MRVLSALALALALGCGGSSGPLPTAPDGLTVQPQQAAALVQWSGVAEATSYVVYAAAAPARASTGRGIHVAATGAGTYSSFVNGLISGVAYNFAVAAANANGQGPLSAEATATPQ